MVVSAPADESPTPVVLDVEAPAPQDSTEVPERDPAKAKTDDAGDPPTADTSPADDAILEDEPSADDSPANAPDVEPADEVTESPEPELVEEETAPGTADELDLSAPVAEAAEPGPEPAESAPATEACATGDEAADPKPEATNNDGEADVESSNAAEDEPVVPESADEETSADDVHAQDEAEQAADEAAPMSRRERRLAEQKVDSDGEPSAQSSAAEISGTETPSVVTAFVSEPESKTGAVRGSRAGKPGAKQKKRPMAFLKAFFFMIVIAAVVVGMGTVLSGKEDASLGQSQTELDRQAAWEKTNVLVEQANTLAGSGSATKVQDLLNQTAKDLSRQAAALSDGLPPNTSNAASPAAATPVSVIEFVLALNASGDELLNSALSAEQAMGRVFAAAGTSRVLQAQTLASAVGSAPVSSAFLPARVDFAAPKAPDCKSALEPRPGATIDSALRAAALGEQKAIYAYQVATTRMSEPQFSQSATLLTRHEAKLKVLNEELRVRCLPLATTVAGFTLDGSFTTTPASALAGLEAELSREYADLAALSTAPAAAAAATAAPQAAADGSKTLSNTTELREISVTWLLDSTQSQLLWGGSLSALSGMPDA
ncbi:protein of unknown function [Arthrobacter alpinus]|uniref:DUF4439 domain-containing protein n=2 Tax=Arthrobacter alpinus TaxID=656366 RepID=A0A1H5JXG2_9MICC|nr:protein of unknown function [Arthrobacter alpinus]